MQSVHEISGILSLPTKLVEFTLEHCAVPVLVLLDIQKALIDSSTERISNLKSELKS